MTRNEHDVLRRVRRTSTDGLVAMWRGRDAGATIEAATADRWLGLALLAELFRRDEIDLLTGKLSIL